MMSTHVLGAGTDDPLYTDASIDLSITVDTDLTAAQDIFVEIYDPDSGSWVEWGRQNDMSSVTAGSTVTLAAEPEKLPTPLTAGRYTGRWKYTDGSGDTDTIEKFLVDFKSPDE
jgi:hypothetical protein